MKQAAEKKQDPDGGEAKKGVYPIQSTAAPKALVVHCGDPRFQEPIARFLAEELGLKPGKYVPLVVGGGVASLMVGDMLPKEAKSLREGIAFYVSHFASIERIILINHEDCGKYRALERALPLFLHLCGGIMTDRQKTDLRKAVEGLTAQHLLSVEPYFAAFTNPEHTLVHFEKQ
jgi:hypothetical protein